MRNFRKLILACYLFAFPTMLLGQQTSDEQSTMTELLDRLTAIENRLVDLEEGPNTNEPASSESPAGSDDSWQEDPDVIVDSQLCTNTLLEKDIFDICYSNDWLVAQWVGYYLTSENLEGSAGRVGDFRRDPDLAEEYQSQLEDYSKSGYDRGHMAPSAAFQRSREDNSTTFLLSNMAPQTGELNRKSWRMLEAKVRDLAEGGKSTWVFTGNLVPPEATKLNDRVSIPSHCFKAILHIDNEGKVSAYAFLLPNTASGIGGFEDFQITIDDLEDQTGIDFFAALPDPLESQVEKMNDAWDL